MRNSRMSLLAVFAVLGMVLAACGGTAEEPEECAADSFGCVTVAEGEPIKLGALLVISGPNSSLGLDSQYGLELALDYADGTMDEQNVQIAGHDVQLVVEDDGCSAEGGTAGANKLAADTQITAVIGTSCSSAALGTADKILGDKGITLMSPSNTSPALTNPATHNPFYFRTAHNDKIQGAAVAQFAFGQLGSATAATVHDGSPYAEGLADAFAETFAGLGGEVLERDAIQVGDTDFSGLLSTLAGNPPDFLFFPIFVAEGALLAQQAKTALPGTTVLAGADGLWSADFYTAVGDGVYLSGPDVSALAGDTGTYNNVLLPEYAARYGSEPLSAFHAHAWDAANIVLKAIEDVAIDQDGTLYIPRTALRDAIGATSGFPGITGTLTCNADGDCQPSATIAVFQVANGAMDTGSPVFSTVGTLEG
jgi:branched-chain amino acid transport system substrate-binding protein